MAPLVAAIVALVALAGVLYPLFRGDGGMRHAVGRDGSVQELIDRRETLFRAMAEMEFDRKLGNLAGEEYQRLRADYEVQAMDVLKSLDQRAAGVDAQIDQEIAAYRDQGVETVEPGQG